MADTSNKISPGGEPAPAQDGQHKVQLTGKDQQDVTPFFCNLLDCKLEVP
jgi:hypothetical protein